MSSRILAIDAGNTRIKWGLHNGLEWFSRGAVDVTDISTCHTLGDVLSASLIDHVVISNVAGPTIANAIEEQIKPLGKPLFFVRAEAEIGRAHV